MAMEDLSMNRSSLNKHEDKFKSNYLRADDQISSISRPADTSYPRNSVAPSGYARGGEQGPSEDQAD